VKAISSPTTDDGSADGSSGLGRSAVRLSRSAIGLNWPFRPGLLDAAWAVFSAINLAVLLAFPGWEAIPFHVIWISFTLLYGFRIWAPGPTLWVLGLVMAATAAGTGLAVVRGSEPPAELAEVPLMAALFGAVAWHARRKLAAEQESRLVGEQNARLLTMQRRFLQDASHQLRTPITIAMGHAELLAGDLAGRPEGNDIQVVLGELNRLRRIAERLLVIAAAEGPEFLRVEPVALDTFIVETLRRWRPTVNRRWQLGRLDKATVQADRERLGLAIDALLENAVRHTGDGDVIRLSVVAGEYGMPVRVFVADGGQGIPADLVPHVFDRFRSGDGNHPSGTGLGLALVQAVARAHGGEVLVSSRPGRGSEFELRLPGPTGPLALPPAAPARADTADDELARKP
jgi:signal transduction histidine kinase